MDLLFIYIHIFVVIASYKFLSTLKNKSCCNLLSISHHISCAYRLYTEVQVAMGFIILRARRVLGMINHHSCHNQSVQLTFTILITVARIPLLCLIISPASLPSNYHFN